MHHKKYILDKDRLIFTYFISTPYLLIGKTVNKYRKFLLDQYFKSIYTNHICFGPFKKRIYILLWLNGDRLVGPITLSVSFV